MTKPEATQKAANINAAAKADTETHTRLHARVVRILGWGNPTNDWDVQVTVSD